MPKLQDFRQVKEVALPSYPDSKVVVYDSLLVGSLQDLEYKKDNLVDLIIKSLPLFIKSWNFTDENDKPLEINSESIKFLKESDARFLLEQIAEFNKEVKKNSAT